MDHKCCHLFIKNILSDSYLEDSESDSMGNGLLSKSPELTKEVTLPPTKPPCTSPSVLCPGSTICIKRTQMCDGKRDCPDGSDEKCIKRCSSDSKFFFCTNHIFMLSRFVALEPET